MEIDQIQSNNFPIISNGFGRLVVPTKMDEQNPDEEEEGANKRRATNSTARGGVGVNLCDGGGVGRFNGWPSSRIVRVSRASGGKDRHSKVLTSKGLRDRRVRLSVTTAIQFYDLQDRLGVDQPSKAVEWLLKAAAASITELPPMNSPFLDTHEQLSDEKRNSSTAGNDLLAFDSGEVDMDGGGTSYFLRQQMPTKSSACSSNSENSKGSALSLSRSESWIITGEEAKKRDADKKKVKENESSHVASFTELLSAGINSINSNGDNGGSVRQNPRHWSSDNYFNSGVLGPPATRPRQNFTFAPAAGGNGGGSEYNLNFTISSANNSSSGVAALNRGTLQSNSSPPPSLLHQYSIQRFNPPSDGSSQNFFIGGENHQHFLSGFDAGLQLYYGDTDAHSDKGKSEKN